MSKIWRGIVVSPLAQPASLFLVLNLFLFQPALSYWNNLDEFHYSLGAVMMVLLPLFIFFYYLLQIPAIGETHKWQRVYVALLAGLAVSSWVSNLFVGSVGVLDGKAFALELDPKTIQSNLWIIAGVSSAIAVVHYFKPKIINALFLIISIPCIFIVVGVAMMHGKAPFLSYSQSQIKLNSFSKQKNVLVILLDTFQSDFFEEILNREPNLVQEFSGFTYYPQALSVSPSTFLAMPTIHSGVVFKKGGKISQLYRDTMAQSFLNDFTRQGYDSLLVNPYMRTPQVAKTDAYAVHSPGFGVISQANDLLNFSFFRSVPHIFKKYIYHNGYWLPLLTLRASPDQVMANGVLDILAQYSNTNSVAPTIKFLHLYNTHAPAILDAHCHLRSKIVWNRDAAIDQDQCAVDSLVPLLQKLKKLGIYNQTEILIFGDHGAGMTGKRYLAPLAPFSNPLFLFKPFNASETALTNSSLLVSLIDIKATLCADLKTCSSVGEGTNILQLDPNTRRTLPFNFYNYYDWGGSFTDTIPVSPYQVMGSPFVISSWEKESPTQLAKTHELSLPGQEADKYLGVGWGQQGEGNVRWGLGSKSDIYLPLTPQKNNLLSFTVFTHAANKNQVLSILVNNQVIKTIAIPPYVYQKVFAVVPANLITGNITHIIFQSSESNVSSPEDTRPLSVAFLGSLGMNVLGDEPFNSGIWQKIPTHPLPPIQALELPNINSNDYLGVGWGERGEGQVRWALGPQADIFLPLPPNKDVKLSFTAMTHPANKNQTLAVWVNNQLIQKINLPINHYNKIAVIIPARLTSVDPTHIVFQFSEWNPPSDIDKRPLAVGFLGDLSISS